MNAILVKAHRLLERPGPDLPQVDELNDRHLALKLRDGVAWLFSPYL